MSKALKCEFVEICKLLYLRGLAKAWGGNVSVRNGKNHIIIIPKGTSLFDISLDDLVVTTLDGLVVEGGQPSSELPMHSAIYHARSDIGAIIHIHSLYSTLYSILKKPIELFTAESKILIGALQFVEYAEPGSQKLAGLVVNRFKDHSACILARYGIVVGGSSLKNAYYLAELIEEAAKLNFLKKLVC
ncbi:class II aldolase/adducin family protein [Candidatus Borrarchaeum sp.]|uniref:class II aldolase/adducin family protein n=1 Tax=Candidatus Borrarchaeum sp. TaxID=2846742 RepID=UPI002579A329|nr:class II aldolase/adducin family protein [Candidatus Borrarchaeum sp.]